MIRIANWVHISLKRPCHPSPGDTRASLDHPLNLMCVPVCTPVPPLFAVTACSFLIWQINVTKRRGNMCLWICWKVVLHKPCYGTGCTSGQENQSSTGKGLHVLVISRKERTTSHMEDREAEVGLESLVPLLASLDSGLTVRLDRTSLCVPCFSAKQTGIHHASWAQTVCQSDAYASTHTLRLEVGLVHRESNPAHRPLELLVRNFSLFPLTLTVPETRAARGTPFALRPNASSLRPYDALHEL